MIKALTYSIATITDVFITIGTVTLAWVAYREWGTKTSKIRISTFPPVTGTRIEGKKSYIFYFYAVNHGNTTASIRDIKMSFIYKDGRKEQLNRVKHLKQDPKFKTPREDIEIDYDNKKFPINELLEQGKPVRGFVIFEKDKNDYQDPDIKEVEINTEDSFGSKHRSKIPRSAIELTQENLDLLIEHSGVEFPDSALPPKK